MEITIASTLFLIASCAVALLVIVPVEIWILERLLPCKMMKTQFHSHMYSMYRNSSFSEKL